MEIKPIRTASDYKRTPLRRSSACGMRSSEPRKAIIDVLATLVEAYEKKHFPIDPPEAIRN